MKNKKFKFILVVCVIIIIALSVVLIINKKNKVITTSMQFEYFGLNRYYNNEDEKLTVGEATKILSSLYNNVYDISEIVIADDIENKWKYYAYSNNIISNNEYNNELSYLRFFELVYDYEINIRNQDIEVENKLNMDSDNYTQSQIDATNYLYTNQIITSDFVNILNDKINKNNFEDIIVKCIFRFNLIYIGDNTINYDESLNIQPGKDYFFVTNNTDNNKILNYKLNEAKKDDTYLDVKNTYKEVRNDLEKLTNIINGYYNIILNFDYNSIDVEKIYDELITYSIVNYDEVKEYCEYIENNKIKITGKVNIVYPIIYSINNNYYVRVVIDYNIDESLVKKVNLFNGNNNSKYLDVKINKVGNLLWKIDF